MFNRRRRFTEPPPGLISTVMGGGGVAFLFRDDFTTDEGAPLTSPRTAEPGPGAVTLVQDVGQWDITTQTLNANVGAGNFGDLSYVVEEQTLAAGLCAYTGNLNIPNSSGQQIVGWASTADPGTGSIWGLGFSGSSDLKISTGNLLGAIGTYTGLTDYKVAIVSHTTTGLKMILKGGTFAEWTLLWVDLSSVKTRPTILCRNRDLSADTFRVTQLGAPFASMYGLATDASLSGSVSAGNTFSHEADCLIEYTVTTVQSAGLMEVHFRIQDSPNYWGIRITASGDINLQEVVDSVITNRGTAAGVIADGERVVIIADDESIKIYGDNTELISYGSAANFKTETDGEVDTLGTGGAVDALISWPRTLSGQALTALNNVVNA